MEENSFVDDGEGIVWLEKKESKFKLVVRKFLVPFKFFDRVAKRFAGLIAVFALLLGGTGVYLGVGPYFHYVNTDPAHNGLVEPRNLGRMLAMICINCKFQKMVCQLWRLLLAALLLKKLPARRIHYLNYVKLFWL